MKYRIYSETITYGGAMGDFIDEGSEDFIKEYEKLLDMYKEKEVEVRIGMDYETVYQEESNNSPIIEVMFEYEDNGEKYVEHTTINVPEELILVETQKVTLPTLESVKNKMSNLQKSE